jgi:hypothetical protein
VAVWGTDSAEVGDRLEREGVEKFADSYNAAVDTIGAKRAAL